MSNRTVCVVTGTRADYGLLSGLMKEIDNDRDLRLQIIASGMHLSPQFGLTYRFIEQDGFLINEKVEMLLSGDTPASVTKSVGLALIGFADAYQRLQPDIVVILGDRTEALAAAQAALITGIPIAHIHGGEVTVGAIDDAIRHAITKMSHLHFVAADSYRERVVQMGEAPEFVINVGALGIENINRFKLLDRQQLEPIMNLSLDGNSFLVTYHPATIYSGKAKEEIAQLTEALDAFPEASIIFTKPNSDSEGQVISEHLEHYAQNRPDKVKVFESLGQLNYLSMLKECAVVIGNSSSGIIEAPFFRKATVNIGLRQDGRLKAKSIIDCDANKHSIISAIQKALSPQFQKFIESVESLYGEGETAKKITEKLKSVDLNAIRVKKFYDIVQKGVLGEYDIHHS